ncbi:uncharacterized protein E0L32_007107 [Thyridium curvatum]|uniref:Uncharacterized protein n=1 Tax=Thyridium curvatum TaxID=1093900 RepID=A0A507B591_9PEZI|nr:uncharacterized protein E0L32_007107 [Thyridium curvatum]TPX12221.1 hypothetical protein E0L32_007107 [Thyridium curvatum]
MNTDLPEELLGSFKEAAFQVTKLYKAAAAAHGKGRADGYQDCLDDLLAFLDKENIGAAAGEGWKVRNWASERLVRRERDGVSQTAESEGEEEADKVDTASSPELHRADSNIPMQPAANYTAMRTDSAPPSVRPSVEDAGIVVPSQDTFEFRSQMQYPQDSSDLSIATLDLSDSRSHEMSTSTPAVSIARPPRPRHNAAGQRNLSRSSNLLGRGAGQKRKLNIPELEFFESLGHYGKDFFGNRGGKRNKHA